MSYLKIHSHFMIASYSERSFAHIAYIKEQMHRHKTVLRRLREQLRNIQPAERVVLGLIFPIPGSSLLYLLYFSIRPMLQKKKQSTN